MDNIRNLRREINNVDNNYLAEMFELNSGYFRFEPEAAVEELKAGDFYPHDRSNMLGRGSHGTVYKTERTSNKFALALKICTIENTALKPKEEEWPWHRELEFLRIQPKHENIVWLYGYIIAHKPSPDYLPFKSLSLYMELMDFSFRDILIHTRSRDCTPFKSVRGGTINMTALQSFLKQVSCGFKSLHEKGFMHRDVKPDNILVKSDGRTAVVKLTDFGATKVRAAL